jgi:H+-transporting ATPase
MVSARTGEEFVFRVAPAQILLWGGVMALGLSSILSLFWPQSVLDGIETEGLHKDLGLFFFTWIYCLLFWFIQDLLKVAVFKVCIASVWWNL